MTQLRELFEEAANSAPPSRLIAEEVYAAGRRQRRRRSSLAAGTAAVATCAAMGAVVALAGTGPAPVATREPSAAGVPSTSQQMPSPGLLPHAGERIQWAGAADATHLYLSSSTCAKRSCGKLTVQLVGSDDGGRTWSDRGTPMYAEGLAVASPDTLVAAVRLDPLTDSKTTVMTSTDGGRTWATAEPAAAVDAVPGGSTAMCLWQTNETPCTLHAVDPTSHRIAPLANQPELATVHMLEHNVEESDGWLWIGGTDRATGRLAVAESADGGRTWSTQVFADAPACSHEGCLAPWLAVGAGGTAYVVTPGDRDQAVYRRTDGVGRGTGSWQRIADIDHIKYTRGVGNLLSFVAADGTHVLYRLEGVPDQGADVYRFWAARDGKTYRSVELDGLPGTAGPVRRTPGGWFYALDRANGSLYGSTDGWHWSPVARTS